MAIAANSVEHYTGKDPIWNAAKAIAQQLPGCGPNGNEKLDLFEETFPLHYDFYKLSGFEDNDMEGLPLHALIASLPRPIGFSQLQDLPFFPASGDFRRRDGLTIETLIGNVLAHRPGTERRDAIRKRFLVYGWFTSARSGSNEAGLSYAYNHDLVPLWRGKPEGHWSLVIRLHDPSLRPLRYGDRVYGDRHSEAEKYILAIQAMRQLGIPLTVPLI